MDSSRTSEDLNTFPKQSKVKLAASCNPSVQEVLDIVHSQQIPKGNAKQSNNLNMGRLGQTVPLPAISKPSLPPRPSTSYGDRFIVTDKKISPQDDPLSRSFPPPLTSLNLKDTDPRTTRSVRSVSRLGKMNKASNVIDQDNYFHHGEKPTRPQTSYGRRRVPVHGTLDSNNQIIIPTCPVNNEFRSSSSQGDVAIDDDRDAEIMKICKSSRKGSKRRERERCNSPVKGLLMRKSSVD